MAEDRREENQTLTAALAVLASRFDDFTRLTAGQLGMLTQQLTNLPEKLDETYLRRELYEAHREAEDRVRTGLRTDLDAIVDQQRQNRRLALSGIVLPILATVMAALILVAILP